jgi:hypothetical protein
MTFQRYDVNPRIQELMIEAGYAAPELAGRAKKLAELIVRDCAAFVDSHDQVDRYGEALDTVWGSDILKHYGIES